jgi:hypothetical protein
VDLIPGNTFLVDLIPCKLFTESLTKTSFVEVCMKNYPLRTFFQNTGASCATKPLCFI